MDVPAHSTPGAEAPSAAHPAPRRPHRTPTPMPAGVVVRPRPPARPLTLPAAEDAVPLVAAVATSGGPPPPPPPPPLLSSSSSSGRGRRLRPVPGTASPTPTTDRGSGRPSAGRADRGRSGPLPPRSRSGPVAAADAATPDRDSVLRLLEALQVPAGPMTAMEPLASLLGRVTATLTARSAVPLPAELYDWVLATLEHMLLSPRYCRCAICAERGRVR